MKRISPLPIDYLEYRARSLQHRKQVYMWTGVPGQYQYTHRPTMRESHFYRMRARYVRCLQLIRQIDAFRWYLPCYMDILEDCAYDTIDYEALFFMNVQ